MQGSQQKIHCIIATKNEADIRLLLCNHMTQGITEHAKFSTFSLEH